MLGQHRPASEMPLAFRWWADDGRLLVVFESSLSLINKKKTVRVGPPLTILSGSAHALHTDTVNTYT